MFGRVLSMLYHSLEQFEKQNNLCDAFLRSEVYLEPYKRSTMKLFAKIVYDFFPS